MPNFTIDKLAEIRYELDEREIYNDIRSEIGVLISETIVDADPTYNWQVFTRYATVAAGDTVRLIFEADHTSATNWQLHAHAAVWRPFPGFWLPYYDYAIDFATVVSPWKYRVKIENTGPYEARFVIGVKYKYQATEIVTHEGLIPLLLTVRATDATSIRKYGRRVMNLTWSEGTPYDAMQSVIDFYLLRHKEPVPRLRGTIKGTTDTLRTQIIATEISDTITIICAELGLNADFFVNAISINDDPTGIPVCKWGLEGKRDYEILTIFTLDTSELGGAHILGS